MATKIIVTFSSAQAEALVKALASVPKQSKTVEALSAKVKDALATTPAA